MGKKEDHKTRSFTNDLDHNFDDDHDPDFDLDEYIRRQSEPTSHMPLQEETKDPDSYLFKNAILIFIVFAAAFLWFNSWSDTESWRYIFGGGDQTTEVTAGAPGVGQLDISIPQPPQVPPVPGVEVPPAPPAPSLDMTITEYLSVLQDRGYLGDEISGFSARQLYDANVPVSYLDELQNAGFLEDLSFVYISNYYQNQIPLPYLKSLQDAGVYEELSFVDVTAFYNDDIPVEYLVTLNEAGYLEDLSFVYVTNFYNAGVTVEFLDQLKEQGLYEDLNFLDIVDLYQRENSDD
ncbi:hypothetical protein [Gracilimonas sp. BCB1]|uniref:hypothetical protein n=1 Tax=Gracilimonas sp. BCB1 TaxID=3152362 RepID=UPI0032D96FAF